MTGPAPVLHDAAASAMRHAADLLARDPGFDRCEFTQGMVIAHAADAPESALYRVEADPEGLFVSWVSPDRYLSQSIEQDLVYAGDDLDDMIDEELADTGYAGPSLAPMQHYRNDEKLFVFRSRTPIDARSCDAARAGHDLACFIRAYHAALSQLGDMSPDEED